MALLVLAVVTLPSLPTVMPMSLSFPTSVRLSTVPFSLPLMRISLLVILLFSLPSLSNSASTLPPLTSSTSVPLPPSMVSP